MKRRSNLFLLLCVLFTAFSLRPPIISVTPLVEIIREDLSLSGSAAGLITTIPLLVFAALSPLAGGAAGRFGLGKTLCLALCSICIGIFVRSWLGIPGLMAGTALVGVGIAFGNVLLPAVVKSRYPQRVTIITCTYTTAMNGLAGVASAISVPLAVRHGLGWQNTLLIWSIPPLVGALLWAANRKLRLESPGNKSSFSIWRHKTAWRVALYMGVQSLFFFNFMAWCPSILTAKGFDAETAGYLVTIYQLTGIPGNLLVPFLAARLKDPRTLALIIGLGYTLGLAVFWAAGSLPILIAMLVLMGMATGACFSYCMILMSLRAGNASIAARLSGMSQSVGYVIAAVGPVLLGRLADVTGSWNAALLFMLLNGVALIVFGHRACKPDIIE